MLKFLVIRFSSIGDIVLTTPVVRVLKKQFPDSEIHFLSKKQFSFLLTENPNIDKVIELEDNLRNTIDVLRDENYNHIIDLHSNLRTKRIKSALSIPDFTVDKLNVKKWLLVNLKIDKLPNQHIVDRYLETLSVFDIRKDDSGLDYYIPEKDFYSIEDRSFANGYIAFVVGATYYTKQIPLQLTVDVINKVNLPFVLLGGKDDIEKGNEIKKQVIGTVLNLCGKINLNQSASVIRQSQIVVSSDTGLMHIASAFNKPIVSLWGNTVPKFGMSPYKPNISSKIFEVQNLKCRPCSKIGFNKCPKKHFDCMLKLDAEGIVKYILQAYAKEKKN